MTLVALILAVLAVALLAYGAHRAGRADRDEYIAALEERHAAEQLYPHHRPRLRDDD